MASSSSNNKIVFKTSDGAFVDVEKAVACQLQIVSNMMEDRCADQAIPLVNITKNVLSKVIEYCKKHVEEGGAQDEDAKKELQKWDTDFMKQHDMDLVFQLILAANFFDLKGLLDLTCQTVAGHIKDKQPAEVRAIFNIKKDYTPEEEAKIRKDNEWAFQ